MSTRSSARNLFPTLDNRELTIRRRSRVDPTLLNDFEMATNGNDDDVPPPGGGDLPSLTHHATAWFDRFPRNSINTFEQMAKMFLIKYFPPSMVTKLRNEITNFRQRPDESLFEAWERYKLSIDHCPNHNMLPVTQIDTFYNGLTLRHRDTINAAAGGTFMKRRPEECYDLIENMTAYHNDRDTSIQRSESSSSITCSSDLEIVALKAEMVEINKNLMKVLQINQQVKAIAHNCETCGGPHSYNDCPATVVQNQNVYAAGAYNQSGVSHGQNPPPAYQAPTYQALGYQALVHQASIPQPQVMTTTEFTNYMKENDAILKNMQTNMTSLTNSNLKLKNMFGQFMKMNTASSSGSGTLPSNIITNPKEDLKGITTRSGNAYQGPTIPTTSSLPKVVERETKVTKDTMPPTNKRSTKDVQPSVVQIENLIPSSEPVIAPISEPIVAPVSASKPNQKPSIIYPSRLHDQKLYDKTNDQKEKFFQIFKDLDLNISFTDALILMPKFGPTIKKKMGDPRKFLIPCDFLGLDECLALADLGASINLMPLSVWNKFSLPELSPMCMTLELMDRLISRLVGVVEDIFVKVETFHFLADFVVVDFDADPRVPLILRRSFLKTGCALIDVYEGESTLRVGKEAVTFNLNQTSRYSDNYDAMSVNRIDLIDVACKEYSQKVLGFSVSGNPTPSTKPIVSNSSPTLTPFGNSDFLLEETDVFLAIDDVPILPEIDEAYYDSEGDILLLEEFLNDDLSSPPLHPQELEVIEPTNEKSSIDEPPVVELKDLQPHLEYAFLEGDDNLPVIISKYLKDEEKTALIKVLKSHMQALSWKLSDIKGIDPEFRTHKILMEDDFKPVVQHQRKVNPKIHEVIKKEVLKFLDAGLIYPISDSPWGVNIVWTVAKGKETMNNVGFLFGREALFFKGGYNLRRSHVDHTLLNDFEMATDENGDLPAPDLQIMEELCQPTLNGWGGPIAPIPIQATNFGLKNDMIQQVQNSCQFHGLPGDDANKHLDKFLHVTQSIKVNGVTDDALCLYLFPYSLTHHATAWFDRLPRNSINTFEQMAKKFFGKYLPPSMVTKLRNEITNFRQRPDELLFKAGERGTFMKRRLEECYDLIKNMTAHHNDWDTLAQRILQINQQVKAIAHNCETCGGPHSYNDCLATVGQTQNVYAAGAYNQGDNSYQPQGNCNLLSHGQNPPPAYQAPAYQASGYQAPVHQTPIPQPQVVTTT
uniref:Reverse transcriptase domain-containing protein n=1 Tax=Tanacetum cinerariifolium TaxID=118510 RepID=A0A6L2NZN5_TANCI|nr:reverse transcriptase domain-containing protein [Tanacetum cinerariifolium]